MFRGLWRVAATGVVAASVGLPVSVAAEPTFTFTPSGQTFTFDAATLTSSALTYVGTTTDAGTTVLVMTAQSLAVAGYDVTGPCEGRTAGVAATVGYATSGTVSIDAGVTTPVVLHATAMSFDGGSISAAAPPVAPLSLPSTLTHVSVTATLLSAPSFAGPLTAIATTC